MASSSDDGRMKKPEAKLEDQSFCLIVKYPAEQVKFVENGLGCTRCSEIPNPNYYMVCRENGHIMCGRCAWIKSMDQDSTRVATCCNPENLMKGSVKILEEFVRKARWQCLYEEKGCDNYLTGQEWLTHVTTCEYRFSEKCCSYGCSTALTGIETTVEHFKSDHGAKEFILKTSTLLLKIPYEEGEFRRLGILKAADESYLLCQECFENELHIWMWDLQTLEPIIWREEKRYRVTLLPGEGSDGSISYEGRFHHISTPCENVVESGRCFSIPIPRLKKNFLRKFASVSSPIFSIEVTILLSAKAVPARAQGKNQNDHLKTGIERGLLL